jgi:thiamine biosynthesis lipoprotein
VLADRQFESMGTTCRVVLTGPGAEAAGESAEALVRSWAAALTRFDPASELSRLNADPREIVPAGAVVRRFVAAAVWAGRLTGGLVDPTLVAEIETAGYAAAPQPTASPAAPPAPGPPAPASPPDGGWAAWEVVRPLVPSRRPASPRASPWWAGVRVTADAVVRPPGLRLDSGGIAKGLIADVVLAREAGRELAFCDCGGDVAVGGAGAAARPWQVAVRHPLTGEVAHRFTLASGGVASSGIARRLWLRPDGTPAHHLLDPATGEPAWTGLVSASAVGRSALEAEALAKAAYLSGPLGARAVLAAQGGLLVHEDGDVEVI